MRDIFRILPLLGVAALVLPCGAGAQLPRQPIDSMAFVPPTLDSTGVRGTVLVYDLRRDRMLATRPSMADERRLPASTFKIVNALIALEVGVVQDEGSVIPWDGIVRPRSELNQDLDLATAFRVSAVPHFQYLARSVGLTEIRRYLLLLGYGNEDASGGVERFWLSGGLRISPREQIELLVKLYQGELPLRPSTMEAVRRIMRVEDEHGVTLRAKTGWAVLEGGEAVGWWVGWVETAAGTFFFASMIEDEDPRSSFGFARTEVARETLRSLGVLPEAGRPTVAVDGPGLEGVLLELPGVP